MNAKELTEWKFKFLVKDNSWEIAMISIEININRNASLKLNKIFDGSLELLSYNK